MTGPQILAFAIVGIAVVFFVWGRFRYDFVALAALLIGIVSGDVPAKNAFSGFTSDVVIIIASALVVSAAIGRSGIIESYVGPLFSKLKRPQTQVPALSAATAVLSSLTKNVGALATLMPIALRMGREKESAPSLLLMPMSFLSLLGGLITLVGTSTNIIVSEVRQDLTGQPFQLFDFAPVGIVLTLAGLLFVSFAWRLLPSNRVSKAPLGEVHSEAAYSTEARISDSWPEKLKTIADLQFEQDKVTVVAMLNPVGKKQAASASTPLTPGSVLIIEGDDAALGAAFTRLPLEAVRADRDVATQEANEERRTIEAVIQPRSDLIGGSAGNLSLQSQYGLKLLGVGRKGQQISERLSEVRLRAGDMLVLQAGAATLSEALPLLGLLPLAERSVTIGDRRLRFGPTLILAGAMALVAMHVIPVAIGFFAAAVLVIAIGSLTMREAYGALDPEVLVLIGALTPLSEAIQSSGGAGVVAQFLGDHLAGWPTLFVLGGLMVAAMASAPFLHNAPTVLVLAPIGAGLAQQLHLDPDAFLMAVATGAGCDFLTPVGHQCNTIVRGPGGYRFGDYWRLGLPLSVIVILLGTPLIAAVWI